MRMQKTEMEFVTFDAQDVITTSGPTPDYPTLTVSGYFDAPNTNNFKVTFGGTDYFNMDALRKAFDAAGGQGAYKSSFSYKDSLGNITSDTFSAAFEDDLKTHSTADVERYSTGNGDYTWNGVSHWIHNNLQ